MRCPWLQWRRLPRSRRGAEKTDAPRERPSRQTAEEIKALKARDNLTNWIYLARIYVVIAASIAGAIWLDQLAMYGQIAWWWSIPVTVVAIIAVGASQHQFGGAMHEGTHYILFANRKLNELASDWLAAFPILTTTFHFRLHHLAHHQFVNDPERDPDISQLHDSNHWLDFPITHVEMLWALKAAVAAQPHPLHAHPGALQRHGRRRPPQPLSASRPAAGPLAVARWAPVHGGCARRHRADDPERQLACALAVLPAMWAGVVAISRLCRRSTTCTRGSTA